MNKDARIYVAGHRGLVGSAILRALKSRGYPNLIARTHAELDLLDQEAVRSFFNAEQPEYVFLAAAKVGGIMANSTYPADFIYKNIVIQTNVIDEAWKCNVSRLLFLGSSCIYPRDCPQPMKEEYLLTGPLEPTNRPYALAKIAGIEMCWSYNRQYGTKYVAAMPTNCYGPGDNYDLDNSHVLPALIRKMHEAKVRGDENVVVWGTGSPRREFLFSDDLADACLFIMNLDDGEFNELTVKSDSPPLINIGCGEDLTISELVDLVAKVVEYNGRIVWDREKPDGTMLKRLDITRLGELGWRSTTTLEEGLRLAYEDYLNGK
ncbi:MAG TPA: GDP-L-fucose synthase [Dissulfurispiraceae bacterium]|nr:GDP-L-fucose synthase [Dissulfurispiraceae bacterium]